MKGEAACTIVAGKVVKHVVEAVTSGTRIFGGSCASVLFDIAFTFRGIYMKAVLALADGRIFEGKSFGATGEATGEVVFNTAMTGYQEVLTDPSYRGQMVTMTYPQIGNTGINPEDIESARLFLSGFIVKEYLDFPSNWRSTMSLDAYLKENGVVGIQGLEPVR